MTQLPQNTPHHGDQPYQQSASPAFIHPTLLISSTNSTPLICKRPKNPFSPTHLSRTTFLRRAHSEHPHSVPTSRTAPICPHARESEPLPPEGGSLQNAKEMDEWVLALETLFLEALKTYYQGTPMFSDSEFETLREELEHLGSTQVRLVAMEKIWVQATSARDFDRRVKEEFEMSEDELVRLKNKLLRSGTVQRPRMDQGRGKQRVVKMLGGKPFLKDATKIEAGERVDERLKWLLFSDASEERFKILLLYLPAVVMSFVTASVFTILFALLDGEMKITVTTAGQFRLSILSYVVVMLTFWFSNQVTPFMLDYLDLGHPTLMRGECPRCSAPVSCLFTGAARTRDERRCNMCDTTVGFNRKWSKVYMVAPPGARKFQDPD